MISEVKKGVDVSKNGNLEVIMRRNYKNNTRVADHEGVNIYCPL